MPGMRRGGGSGGGSGCATDGSLYSRFISLGGGAANTDADATAAVNDVSTTSLAFSVVIRVVIGWSC